MKVYLTTIFKKDLKKIHKNQKKDLDEAIETIMKNLDIGESKIGDLSGVKVYKFKMSKQLTLLSYKVEGENLILLSFGSHANFYEDLKRFMKSTKLESLLK